MKLKITYKINRTGVVTTNAVSNNQCKAIGHKKFEYHAVVKCGPKLDHNGFVIDHVEIHKAIENCFKNGISSCEEMCKTCAESIIKACKKHGCKVISVYLKIKPVGKDVKAFMETEIELKK